MHCEVFVNQRQMPRFMAERGGSCKLNTHHKLLKSMEEYRQEYGKSMSLSHTLEDS